MNRTKVKRKKHMECRQSTVVQITMNQHEFSMAAKLSLGVSEKHISAYIETSRKEEFNVNDIIQLHRKTEKRAHRKLHRYRNNYLFNDIFDESNCRYDEDVW